MKIITDIIILQNYELEVTFKTGEVRYFDLKPYFGNESVFNELKTESKFRMVKNRCYFIEWPNEIDLSSDTIFYESRQNLYSEVRTT